MSEPITASSPDGLATRPPDRPTAGGDARASAAMLLVCLIWGFNFSIMKVAFAAIPVLAFSALRFAAASAALGFVLWRRTGRLAMPAGAGRQLVLLGLIGNTAYQLAFMEGLAHTTASNSALILASVPTLVVLLGVILGVERPSAGMVAGVLSATLGVALVIAARGVAFDRRTLEGDLLTVTAAACWAGFTVAVRRLPKSITALEVTTFTTITGMPGLVLAGVPDLVRMHWGPVPAGAWAALGYASLVSLVLAYLIWNASVQRIGSNRTAIYLCVTPLVAVAAAWVLLGERPVPLQWAGAVLIIAGVLLSLPRVALPRGGGAG
ncbi:MAG TPA: DMT family transporter [Gemmatimonadales bacterium]|nr:DMT family transporter [Gemmatimonadales bacterium]